MLETEYFLFKTFAVFRDRLVPIIDTYRNDINTDEIYRHIFISPFKISRYRAHHIKGAFPLVCIWPTSALEFNKDTKAGQAFYARSIFPVALETCATDENGNSCGEPVRPLVAHMVEYQRNFSLYASSYFVPFRDRVNEDLLTFDLTRYVKIPMSEIACGFSTTAEFMLNTLRQTDSVDERTQVRRFDLEAQYQVRMMIPMLANDPTYPDRVRIFLQSNLIWEHDFSTST